MNEFAEVLTELINKYGVKINEMAKYCQIDRTTLYKFMNGKRKPTSNQIVLQAAEYMSLTPLEISKLQKAYEITWIGRDIYYRRKSITQFLKRFNTVFLEPDLSQLNFSGIKSSSKSNETIVIKNETELQLYQYSLIKDEIFKKDPHFYLWMQPDDISLLRHFRSLISQNPNSVLEHLFSFQSLRQMDSETKYYNLNCLENILPMYLSTFKYESRIYYSVIESLGNFLPCFPSFLVTSDAVLFFNSIKGNGMLIYGKEQADFMKENFNYSKKYTKSPIEKTDNMVHFLSTHDIYENDKKPRLIFQMSPCILPFITDDILERYIKKDIPHRKEFIQAISDYIKRYNILRQKVEMHHIFCLEGVKKILKTGYLDEFPESYYDPLELKDRIYIVEELMKSSKTSTLKVLKEPLTQLESGLSIAVGDKNCTITMKQKEKDIICLNITDYSMVEAFRDYMEAIPEIMFYTSLELDEQLHHLIDQYAKKDGTA